MANFLLETRSIREGWGTIFGAMTSSPEQQSHKGATTPTTKKTLAYTL